VHEKRGFRKLQFSANELTQMRLGGDFVCIAWPAEGAAIFTIELSDAFLSNLKIAQLNAVQPSRTTGFCPKPMCLRMCR
jgi:hypothetical protein